MAYKVKKWVYIMDEDVEVFSNKDEASAEKENWENIHPENKYEVVECDDFGEEV